MAVIARDNVAADSLVYAWPFPIGPECEVSCANDEQVIMCPAWVVGDRLGPGRHIWRTPDPSRPVSAYFVLTEPVEVPFDCTTHFLLPSNGQPIRLRAAGTLNVRCADPGLLVAQFVGLPFDAVNDGVMRSVSRSAERMIARLLTRRVVMAGTPIVVTDATMQQPIIDELVAYNPTAGAVFGIELMRISALAIHADDGNKQYATPNHAKYMNGNGANGAEVPSSQRPTPALPEPSVTSTARGLPPAYTPRRTSVAPGEQQLPPPLPSGRALPETKPPPIGNPSAAVSGEIGGSRSQSSGDRERMAASGEIGGGPRPRVPTPVLGGMAPLPKPPNPPNNEEPTPVVAAPGPPAMTPPPVQPRSPQLVAIPTTPPSPTAVRPRVTGAVSVEVPGDEITHPVTSTPVPGSMRASAVHQTPATPIPAAPGARDDSARGSIMGIGMSQIGHGSVAGEIPTKVKVGGRVLVPGPNGLMQSATVRQLLQGYYELEVGSSGETIWVPIGGVVPEP